MNKQYVLADLYCKAGGATKGYQDAGFYVIGVDIDPQPHYCGDEFVQMDSLKYIQTYGHMVDAFGASPPCELYTKASIQWRKKGYTYPDLIEVTREHLALTGKPYVIENVPGSPLIDPIFLNGSMFGIKVHRPRLFEFSGFEIPPFIHPSCPKPVKMGRPVKEGDVIQPVGHFSGVSYARKEMGIDWMNIEELAHAIPPCYTHFIGGFMLKSLHDN